MNACKSTAHGFGQPLGVPADADEISDAESGTEDEDDEEEEPEEQRRSEPVSVVAYSPESCRVGRESPPKNCNS